MASNPPIPGESDHESQALVLRHILDAHPQLQRRDDLPRELALDPESFAECDAIERAARDLVKAGLLFHLGECLIPTVAALHFDDLPAC